MSLTVSPHAGPVKVSAGGVDIVNTTRALELIEGSLPPVLYVPREDTDMSALVRSDYTSFCMAKGDANYFHIRGTDGSLIEDAVWSYETPIAGVTSIKEHLAFYPHKVDIVLGA
ncbi:MAG: DUF427 domain-containing protein [Pseudomonadota bacterium]